MGPVLYCQSFGQRCPDVVISHCYPQMKARAQLPWPDSYYRLVTRLPRRGLRRVLARSCRIVLSTQRRLLVVVSGSVKLA
jgi:hypothetical protein